MTETGNPRVVLVVPTVRQECMRQFLDAWEPEFAGHELIVVEDNPERTFELRSSARITHYSWRDIDQTLGENRWIVPRRTDCVRSFGYWQAWRRKPDLIVTLDDDCLPPASGPRGFLAAHWQRLEQGGAHDAWVSTTNGTVPRGVPYHERQRRQRAVINHGLWTNVIDYDAITQLSQVRTPTPVDFPDQTIPRGAFYPMCGMNLAFRPEIAPALYFLLMGRDWGVDRFGDIWAGLFSKRICDHLGWAVNSGSPTVHHARASNVWANLRKEAPGMERNETLWRLVDGTVLTATTAAGCYRELAAAVAAVAGDDPWLQKVATAMRLWSDLFVEPTVALQPQPGQREKVPAGVLA
jgi:reversibly glycosylated polypeptide/UDP-arabinopyranose mutase